MDLADIGKGIVSILRGQDGAPGEIGSSKKVIAFIKDNVEDGDRVLVGSAGLVEGGWKICKKDEGLAFFEDFDRGLSWVLTEELIELILRNAGILAITALVG